jgi:hypothetical protein
VTGQEVVGNIKSKTCYRFCGVNIVPLNLQWAMFIGGERPSRCWNTVGDQKLLIS